MKRLLLSIAMSVLSYASFAQTCEYEKNEKDPFLKINKVETKETLIWNWQTRLSFSFANYGGNKLLLANMTLSKNVVFSSGNKMILLFQDGDTLGFDLFSENGKEVSAGKPLTVAGSTYYIYKLMYRLDNTQKLEGKKLEGVRIYTNQSYLEFKPGKTGLELGGAGKEKKLARIEKLFTKENLDCINI